MYYPVFTYKWIQRLLPHYLYRFSVIEGEKRIYLTFDDGPIPIITPWVLEQLAQYQAKATFFCVGANIEKNPAVFQQVLDAGHRIGNHTFNHLNAWKTTSADYFQNIEKCQQLTNTKLFRPPYGKLWFGQTKRLQQDYKIVLWEVIAGDFDPTISKEQCWQNILQNTSDGAIIVLHDSKKSWERLEYVLPQLLKHYSDLGFVFEAIS